MEADPHFLNWAPVPSCFWARSETKWMYRWCFEFYPSCFEHIHSSHECFLLFIAHNIHWKWGPEMTWRLQMKKPKFFKNSNNWLKAYVSEMLHLFWTSSAFLLQRSEPSTEMKYPRLFSKPKACVYAMKKSCGGCTKEHSDVNSARNVCRDLCLDSV